MAWIEEDEEDEDELEIYVYIYGGPPPKILASFRFIVLMRAAIVPIMVWIRNINSSGRALSTV